MKKHTPQKQTNTTHKKLTHITVRQIPDSGYFIPVISRLSTERDTNHGNRLTDTAALQPVGLPPDQTL